MKTPNSRSCLAIKTAKETFAALSRPDNAVAVLSTRSKEAENSNKGRRPKTCDPFFVCPAGHTCLEVQVSYGPGSGNH